MKALFPLLALLIGCANLVPREAAALPFVQLAAADPHSALGTNGRALLHLAADRPHEIRPPRDHRGPTEHGRPGYRDHGFGRVDPDAGQIIQDVIRLLSRARVDDPYHWPGTWDANQAARINAITQTANWHDVAQGHGDPGADGDEAARAVDRLRHDKVKRLPKTETTDFGVQQGNQ